MAEKAPFDYTGYEEQPEVEDLKRLSELAAHQIACEAEVIKAEEALRKAQDDLRQVNEFELPEVMDRLKLEQFKTTDGLEIEVTEKIRASIAKKNQAAGFKWLRDNGHDAIIKRIVKVQFGKGEDAQADKLKHMLDDPKTVKKLGGVLNLSDDSTVHAGTLSSLVKKLLEDGEEVPDTTLGVFRQRISKVK